jgi:hypothetical protein
MSIKINKTKLDSAIITAASFSPNNTLIKSREDPNHFFMKGSPTFSITISIQGDEDCKKMMKLIQEYSIVWK